jgi:hypothetical protein
MAYALALIELPLVLLTHACHSVPAPFGSEALVVTVTTKALLNEPPPRTLRPVGQVAETNPWVPAGIISVVPAMI